MTVHRAFGAGSLSTTDASTHRCPGAVSSALIYNDTRHLSAERGCTAAEYVISEGLLMVLVVRVVDTTDVRFETE